MSSAHLLKISERSGHVNVFNFGFKVASYKIIFSTTPWPFTPKYALVTLAVMPKYPLLHFGYTRVKGDQLSSMAIKIIVPCKSFTDKSRSTITP